ncbi:Hypothetical predicted protein [Olea europaea subsp. europaea]|nr:Hypothetical predicted protein [Olea europaea subsp. europaea]
MPSRRKLSRELRMVNRKFTAEIEPVKNIRRASQIVSNGFYAASVGEIEKIMIRYIKELGLKGTGEHFEHVISTRNILRKLRIYLMVGMFLEESHLFGKKRSIVTQLFHILLIDVMQEMEFTMEDLQNFEDRIPKMGNQSHESTEDLFRQLYSLEYEGALSEAAYLNRKNVTLAEKIVSSSTEASLDEEMNLEALFREQEEEEEEMTDLKREEWRSIVQARIVDMERKLCRERRGRRGGRSWTCRGRRGSGSWTHRGRTGRRGGSSWTHSGRRG